MKKYVMGIDFGTLSARALIVDALSGEEISEAVSEYEHGVMDETLWDGAKLPPKSALQHPNDYIHSLKSAVSETIAKSGLSADMIGGSGYRFHGLYGFAR